MYLDENVQEANGSVGLCDDGIDVSPQEGFWFEYWLLHSVRSKLRSDLKKKKLQVKSFKQKNEICQPMSRVLFFYWVCLWVCVALGFGARGKVCWLQ